MFIDIQATWNAGQRDDSSNYTPTSVNIYSIDYISEYKDGDCKTYIQFRDSKTNLYTSLSRAEIMALIGDWVGRGDLL